MSNYTAEQITNFWSHFPNGITFGELVKITPEESLRLQSEYLAKAIVQSEVTIENIAA